MKKLLLCMAFSLAFLCFAENWREINGHKIQTTIGYGKSGVQYICDWIQEEKGAVTLYIHSARTFTLGRFKTSCIIMEDYVFPAEAHTGFTENSIFVRFTQRKLRELLPSGEHEVMVKIAGYEFTTVLNKEYGEFKE